MAPTLAITEGTRRHRATRGRSRRSSLPSQRLMKEPSQRRAAARHDAGGGLVVAAAVGVPDGVLIGPRDLPGNLVTARRLLRADRRPRARLARHEGRTEK